MPQGFAIIATVMITKEKKAEVIASTARHKSDVGSPEAQIAIATARIQELTEHLKENKHDNQARRGLMVLVGQRKRNLKYLQRKNFGQYQAILEKLKLRK